MTLWCLFLHESIEAIPCNIREPFEVRDKHHIIALPFTACQDVRHNFVDRPIESLLRHQSARHANRCM